MRVLKRHVASLLATLATTVAAQTATAAPVGLRNELARGIKAVYCLDSSSAAEPVTGAIAPGGTAAVSPGKLPDRCDHLALHLDGDDSWQFALEARPGSARNIVFSMDAPSANSGEKYPSVLLELEGDAFASPAGGRLKVLAQLLQFGLEPAKWVSFAWPLPDARENSGDFVVAFAGQSWSLAGGGVVFKELVPGMQLAESVTIAAPFANPTVMAVFEELRALECVPRLMEHNGAGSLMTEKGKVSGPNAGDAREAAAEDLWQTVMDQMGRIADSGGGTVRIMFDNEDVRFDLTLDLDAAKATLVVSRKPDAAFG